MAGTRKRKGLNTGSNTRARKGYKVKGQCSITLGYGVTLEIPSNRSPWEIIFVVVVVVVVEVLVFLRLNRLFIPNLTFLNYAT